MKKNKILLIMILILGIGSVVQAQDTTKTTVRNEIALDVSPVFGNFIQVNGSLPGILYRRYYEKGALRARINFSGSNGSQTSTNTINGNNNANTTINSIGPNKAFGTTVRVGYQWNKNFKRAQWYYGIDGLFSHSNYSQSYTSTNTPSSIISTTGNEQTGSNTGYGLGPLTGITYQFNQRFSISAETGINITLNSGNNTNKTVYYYPNNVNATTSSIFETTSNGFSYVFSPVALLLSYRF